MIQIYGSGTNPGKIEIRTTTPEGGTRIIQKDIRTGQFLEEKESMPADISEKVNQSIKNNSNSNKLRLQG